LIESSGIVRRLLIGGSFVTNFVTNKAEPKDIDTVIVLLEDIDFDSLTSIQYTVTDRDALKRRFKGDYLDIIVVRDGTGRMQKAIEFFQTNRDDKQVGIVEVVF